MPIYTDKKTNRFYIEFQYKNERYKERLPVGTTKKDAEKLEVKMKNDLMFQRHGIETQKPLTFERFIDEYFGPYADLHYPPDRYERVALLVKAALPFLRGKLMRNIKAADMERVKASRANLLTMHKTARKPATIEREMSELSAVFSMAVKNDLIDYNPCSRVKRIKFHNELNKVLRREDEEKFFSFIATEWAKDICRFVLHTGLRQNDVMKLTVFQVDFNNAVLNIVQSKTVEPIQMPLNAVAMEILERRSQMRNSMLFASPVTGTEKGSVRMTMLRACIKAKIEPLTIRDLRRTFMTRNAEDGVDTVTNSRLAGHTSTRMIHRYVKSTDLMRKAVDAKVENVKLKAVK